MSELGTDKIGEVKIGQVQHTIVVGEDKSVCVKPVVAAETAEPTEPTVLNQGGAKKQQKQQQRKSAKKQQKQQQKQKSAKKQQRKSAKKQQKQKK